MASGNTLNTFFPEDNEAPAATFATLDSRNAISVLDFDAATEELAVFRAILPGYYLGGGLTIDVYGMATSATSGDVKLGIAIERDNDNNHDLDTDAFATEQTAVVTANGTSGKKFKATVTVSSGANMDSLAASEPYRVKLARKAADGADTMTGDWEFTDMHVKET